MPQAQVRISASNLNTTLITFTRVPTISDMIYKFQVEDNIATIFLDRVYSHRPGNEPSFAGDPDLEGSVMVNKTSEILGGKSLSVEQ